MLSRVTGAIRDILMAASFGDHPSVALFIVAFRFSLLLRRFFGEGPLGSAFIPHYLTLMKTSRKVADDFFTDLLFKLMGITLLIILSTFVGMHLFCYFYPVSIKAGEITSLVTLLLPITVIVALYGLTIALHQSHHRFFCSQVSPVLTNLMWIVGIFWTRNQPINLALHHLTHFVVIGFSLTFLLSLITMPRLSLMAFKRVKLSHLFIFTPTMKNVFRSFLLGIIGVGAMQINIFLDSLFALFSNDQGPIFLWYSQRFYQLAFACFSLAFTASIIPLITKFIKAEDFTKAREFFSKGACRVITGALGASLALIVMGYLCTDVFFGRGAFSHVGITSTAHCLSLYALGLVPAALIPLVASSFYAFNDFKTPMKCSLVSIGVHLICNSLFVFALGLGPASIALTTSISSSMNLYLLYRYSNRNIVHFDLSFLGSTLLIGSLVSLIIGGGVWLVYTFDVNKYGAIVALSMSFIALFYALGALTKNRDITGLVKGLLPVINP